MNERDFVNAILDDPDDELPCLVFADWLEEQGQGIRAEWVRASCERSRLVPGQPGFLGAFDREREAWNKCRPDWWNSVPLSAVSETSERGLIRLEVKSKTAVERLGTARWMPMAIEGGWLSCITVSVRNDSVARVLAAWKSPVREIPIHLRLKEPRSGEALARLKTIPRLIRLDLGVGALLTPGIESLVERPDLRTLRIKLGLNNFHFRVSRELVSELIERVGRLDRLHSLTLEGPRPIEEDPAFLSRLNAMIGLRTLTLIQWPDLTLEALERLKQMRGLRRLNLSACPDSTDEGIARVRTALADLQVQRVPW